MKENPTVKLWFATVAFVCATTLASSAQLQILPDRQVLHEFGGGARRVSVVISNASDQTATVVASVRVLQASSATAVRIADVEWKKLQLLPRQTVIESATLNFPTVNAETRFLIQWIEDTNRVLGTTTLLVYPTNLLAQLRSLAGGEPLGVFDPANQLKPLLSAVAVEFSDLEEIGTDKFQGRLALIGPFESKAQVRAGLGGSIQALAKRGVAVVWLQPPPERQSQLKPSFYVVPEGRAAIVVALHDLTDRLAEKPAAQLKLLQLAETALRPKPLDLPEVNNSN